MSGTDTRARKCWGRRYGAIWNNTGDKAYVRKPYGTLLSMRTDGSSGGSSGETKSNCDRSYLTVCIPKYPRTSTAVRSGTGTSP